MNLMLRNQDDWIRTYKKKGALWIHDGKPKRPHALLTSGKHSNGFFNSELVMEDSYLLDRACQDIVELIQVHGMDIVGIERVVGPAMGAITLAHDIARHISHEYGRSCLRAYAEKEMNGDGKRMVFKRTTIQPKELVLLVEDVLTTGESIELTAAAVTAALGYVLPYVAVLVNRSGLKYVGDKQIVALIDHPMPMWIPDECPLCKEGSAAIRPKSKENWALLNACY
jgi:orotate phosphoribosyltransferase